MTGTIDDSAASSTEPKMLPQRYVEDVEASKEVRFHKISWPNPAFIGEY